MGQGKPGENGGKSGDLLIKIHIENDKKSEFPTISNIWFDFDYFVIQLFPICTQEEKNKLKEYGY